MHVLVEPDSESRNVSDGNTVAFHCYQVHFSLFVLFQAEFIFRGEMFCTIAEWLFSLSWCGFCEVTCVREG